MFSGPPYVGAQLVLRARSNWSSPLDGLRAGARLHTLEGIVRAEVRRIDHDPDTGRFEEEVSWHDSYEAEPHLHHYGASSAPVCWSLVTLDLQEQERSSIERALERFGGNRRKAAAALKISTVTFWRRMKQYGLTS